MKIKTELIIGLLGYVVYFLASSEWGNYVGIIAFLTYTGIIGMLFEIAWALYQIKNIQSKMIEELKKQN